MELDGTLGGLSLEVGRGVTETEIGHVQDNVAVAEGGRGREGVIEEITALPYWGSALYNVREMLSPSRGNVTMS